MSAAMVGVALLVLGTVGCYAVLAGRWVSADPGWYAGLPTPPWQPPPWVFGVMWPLNFLALAVTGTAIALSRPVAQSSRFLVVLAAGVVLALAWAWLFYVPHRLGLAALALGGATAMTWLLVLVAASAVAWAGWALVPYAGWLTVATSLSIAYWWGSRAPS